MTSKYKNKHRAPRKAKMGPLLDRLKSGEAATVLRRLLKAHPDLSSEADGIARSLLHQVEYEDVAAEIEDEIRAPAVTSGATSSPQRLPGKFSRKLWNPSSMI